MALEHQAGDRIPIDFGATRATGIHAFAYRELLGHLNMKPDRIRVYDVLQMLADPEEEVRRYFQSDVIQLHRLRPSFNLRVDGYKPYR